MATIQIPANARVFVLDDTVERLYWFRKQFKGKVAAYREATTADRAIEILSDETFDVVFLDHDLHWMDAAEPQRQHGNGKEVARFLAIRHFAGKVVIHSHADAAAAMQKILPQADRCRFDSLDITVQPA